MRRFCSGDAVRNFRGRRAEFDRRVFSLEFADADGSLARRRALVGTGGGGIVQHPPRTFAGIFVRDAPESAMQRQIVTNRILQTKNYLTETVNDNKMEATDVALLQQEAFHIY